MLALLAYDSQGLEGTWEALSVGIARRRPLMRFGARPKDGGVVRTGRTNPTKSRSSPQRRQTAAKDWSSGRPTTPRTRSSSSSGRRSSVFYCGEPAISLSAGALFDLDRRQVRDLHLAVQQHPRQPARRSPDARHRQYGWRFSAAPWTTTGITVAVALLVVLVFGPLHLSRTGSRITLSLEAGDRNIAAGT